ncbi:MAG TPA: hypothetical protein PKE27_05415 [Povalibacter sp.]|uniref:hypothetical protein n=1 Tax=Povalibacter sp. TaxID=1962978 RepID=UPI002D08F85C|nr:hypothetical protein [Povalibacter sp.]HMN43987.1 hypothetical protein [Povalibacter sp.]
MRTQGIMPTGIMRTGIIGRFALLAAFTTALCVHACALAAPENAEIEAVWKKQQITFVYRGYSTFYTCSALRQKLRSILTELGARDTLTLHGYACDDSSGNARFDVLLESPVAATEENVAALTGYSSEQRLVARVRGEPLPGAADLERFPASWETISFSRNRSMRLDAGDCELVEQLLRAILPLLSVQIVSNNLRCSPFGNLRPPRLTVLALVAQQPDPSAVTNAAVP